MCNRTSTYISIPLFLSCLDTGYLLACTEYRDETYQIYIYQRTLLTRECGGLPSYDFIFRFPHFYNRMRQFIFSSSLRAAIQYIRLLSPWCFYLYGVASLCNKYFLQCEGLRVESYYFNRSHSILMTHLIFSLNLASFSNFVLIYTRSYLLLWIALVSVKLSEARESPSQ